MHVDETRTKPRYEVWRIEAFGTKPALVKGGLTLSEARALADQLDRYTHFVHYEKGES